MTLDLKTTRRKSSSQLLLSSWNFHVWCVYFVRCIDESVYGNIILSTTSLSHRSRSAKIHTSRCSRFNSISLPSELNFPSTFQLLILCAALTRRSNAICYQHDAVCSWFSIDSKIHKTDACDWETCACALPACFIFINNISCAVTSISLH